MKKQDLWLIGLFFGAMAAVNVLLVLSRWMPWVGRWDWNHFGIMVAAAMTVALFSQLYSDNALFKMAEHIFVGVTVGYGLVIGWYQIWVTEILAAFKTGSWDTHLGLLRRIAHWFGTAAPKQQLGIWSIILPGILGLMIYARLSRKFSWISRLPFALLIGFGVGLAIPTTISAYLLMQLRYTMVDLFHNPTSDPGKVGDFAIQWNQILVLVGVMSTLVYFFFSIEHKRVVGAVSRVGIWFLMVAFGASFGYTVMARLTLLIARIDFLFRDWVPLIGR
ncbi:MAG: hypothetical protein PHU85_17235 [Phycisphaerae bacterium]|nr:hypothetical protein [Phycisphaerae bacterium]